MAKLKDIVESYGLDKIVIDDFEGIIICPRDYKCLEIYLTKNEVVDLECPELGTEIMSCEECCNRTVNEILEIPAKNDHDFIMKRFLKTL